MPEPTREQERELYTCVIRARALDVELVRWHRQGIIPGFPPSIGHEATQVGAAAALDRTRDFVFPMYRELGLALAMGVDILGYLGNHNGDWNGGSFDPVASRFTPIQSVVGSNGPHAVGWALGQKIDGRDGVALACIGDGGTSQGDTHEAMNFAGVWKLPVVFLVSNNQWAISVPLAEQVAGGSIAARAAGYGFPGVAIDGNDLLAVRAAVMDAVERARRGEGPTLIESRIYRRGPHATSDDPGRYRTLEDERRDAGEDPVIRYRRSALERDIIDESFVAEVDSEAAVWLEGIRSYLTTLPPRGGETLFENVYAELTDDLVEQRDAWAQDARA
ncbi:thiamine pyrophosphate-dependent enzyme [Microbacterium sp. zg.B48]|uniref:thiamine pyrophosphate-dependent enzyme n=1 Tax=unclassified Microbacterium TaxID=2609290 RepID=UPI00214C11E7|nr:MULTISPECIES: thiamine pyrophosphate-dependent enzyme [unclassified Microbacterium]MCR2764029.1 thiamine pyrophosphate-dependent enzyme [Microbacterium sp. zg.B48]MCR2810450.1 thiamine pyrophosphate-dependent enzyme [Microbacterium sp. zg.B185]WIM18502.1 thiamine pyrophosphate-dependent enzyme [Microbacterium sp. zg-B185]